MGTPMNTTSDSKPEIVEVISRYVELKPKGREFAALCCFHDDSNPSMFVNKSKQIFKCFSCGAGGDVWDFVQQYHKVGFVEAKKIADDGLGGEAKPVQRVVPVKAKTMSVEEATELATSKHVDAMLKAPGLGHHANLLGVSRRSLIDLRCGHHGDKQWSFPMRNDRGQVIGIRIRAEWGAKWAIGGSAGGLFIPSPVQYGCVGPMLICEGPTDTAAGLTLGYYAIGRPSCNSALEMTANFVRMVKPKEVWIVPDPDWPGMNGAEPLAEDLAKDFMVKLVMPGGGQDLRKWVKGGADRAWLERLAANVDYF